MEQMIQAKDIRSILGFDHVVHVFFSIQMCNMTTILDNGQSIVENAHVYDCSRPLVEQGSFARHIRAYC